MMSMTRRTMEADLNPGEKRVRDKRKRMWWIVGLLGLAGFIPGFLLGFTQNDELFAPPGPWPAWIVILTVASFLVAVPLGGWLLQRNMDEMEKANHRKAAVVAATVLVIAYPVWWLLWMGATAPEPIHWVMFLAFYVSFLLSFAFYRLR